MRTPRVGAMGAESDRSRARPPRMRGRVLLLLVAAVITGVFLFLAVRNVDAGDVRDSFEASNPWWIPVSLLVLAAAFLVRSYRWTLLFPRQTRPPLRATLEASAIGYFYNSILPFRAGEAIRVLAMSQRTGIARSETGATVVLERVYDALGLVILLFVIMPWLPRIGWLTTAAILGVCVLLALVTVWYLLRRFGLGPLTLALRPLGVFSAFTLERRVGIAEGVARGLATLRHPREALPVLVWTIAGWLLVAASWGVMLPAFGIEYDPFAALLVVIATNVAMILPSLPSGLGVFEAAVVVALSAYQVPDARALSYALVLHAVNFFPYLVVGALVLASRRSGLGGSRGRRLPYD